jgi:hypothetical protein
VHSRFRHDFAKVGQACPNPDRSYSAAKVGVTEDDDEADGVGC